MPGALDGAVEGTGRDGTVDFVAMLTACFDGLSPRLAATDCALWAIRVSIAAMAAGVTAGGAASITGSCAAGQASTPAAGAEMREVREIFMWGGT